MIPEKEDNCPVCGKDLNQGEYDTQTCSDHWLYGKRIVEEPDRTLHTRIRQLEDEVARAQAMAANARAHTARACLVAWWGSKRVYLEEGEDVEPAIVASVHLLEQALAAQAEKEKANG